MSEYRMTQADLERLIETARAKEMGDVVTKFENLMAEALMYEVDPWLCPRCGTWSAMYPCVSRWDQETAVCSDCGRQEAFIEYRNGTYRVGSIFLHPIDGEFKWVEYEDDDVSFPYDEFTALAQ